MGTLDELPRHPRDHGFGRDRAGHGEGASSPLRPVGGERRTGRRPRHSLRIPGERRRPQSAHRGVFPRERRAGGHGRDLPDARRRRARRGHRPRPDPGGPLCDGRPGQPDLRPSAVGGRADPRGAGGDPRGRRRSHDGERGCAHARRGHRAGLRDLQGRGRSQLARRARHPRADDRPAGRRRPPLRQRRGRQPRHAILLPRRTAAARPRGAPAGGRVRPRDRRPHRPRPRPRTTHGRAWPGSAPSRSG